MNKKQMEDMDSMTIYERIRYKSKNEINDLSQEEQEKLQDMLIENYCDEITKLDDEALLQLADDKGLILP